MKIKFLSFFILAGIIIIPGCIDAKAQPLAFAASDNLYRSIFHPYVGLLNHMGYHMPDVHPQDSFPKGPHQGSESIHTLRDAASLLDRNIEKAEIISMRVEAGIQYQKAEGKEVSRLEALLEKYNFLVEEAKQYRALADKAVSDENNSSIMDSYPKSSSSENVEREYLIKAKNRLIQANYVLKEIFRESQHLMHGSEELNGTSRLSATGEGKASLMGSFALNLHIEEGEIAIPDLSLDSEIYITGNYAFEDKTEMQGEVRLYHIHSADMKISGSRKTVLLRGQKITLTADGEGYVAFLGNGTYSIEDAGGIKKKQNWAHPFFMKE